MGKILVVDDEPDVARAWARSLKIAGHNVLTAYDAETAISLAKENPIDLVILDYMMPAMSGIELLNEIRRSHEFVRSIVISGKLDSSVSEDSILSDIRTNIEADCYLHKPVETERLKAAVTGLLAKKPPDEWGAFAKAKLEAAKPKTRVRAAEKNLNRKKRRRK